MNSPARVSRRMARPRSPPLVLAGHPAFLRGGSPLSGRAACSRLVSGSFHPPLGVLFSFPSRYLCAIGLGTCLDLEAGSSQLPTAKPSRGTLAHGEGPRGLAYGAVTLYGGVFQPTSATTGRPPGARGPSRGPATPHPPTLVTWGFGLVSPPFGRPYSGDPCWFLFLPLLRCFRSGGSRPLPGTPRTVRPRQEVPFGDPGFDGCMRLPRAYRSLPRPSSAPEPSHPPGGVLAVAPLAGRDGQGPPAPIWASGAAGAC